MQNAGRTDVDGGERDVRLGPVVYVEMEGWRPTCDHYTDLYHASFPKPKGRWQRMTWWGRVKARPIPPRFDWPVEAATVLDPFWGSGTTGFVARAEGRKSIGIELSPEYAELARQRTQQLSLLF